MKALFVALLQLQAVALWAPGGVPVALARGREQQAAQDGREPPANISIAVHERYRDTTDDDLLRSVLPEALRNGRLVLADGDVLSGRIVAHGIYIPKKATVFFDGDTELVSTARSRLLGKLVPMATASDTSNRTLSAGHRQEQQGTIKGQDGADGPNLWETFGADATVDFSGFCNPLNIDGADAQGIGDVQGGHGGNGGNVVVQVRGVAKTTLTIIGPLCNQPGGKGGTAIATGAQAQPCEDGNEATATGGNGGRSGSVFLVAPRIKFRKRPSAHFNLGGSGGAAFATASDAVFCPKGCLDGGWGGNAYASAGNSGRSGNVDITTGDVDMNRLLAGLSTNRPEGGFASASSGKGAAGGSDCLCGQPGGNGGWGGRALAYGGYGRYSATLYTRIGNNPRIEVGFDGPPGGNAVAVGGAAAAGAPGGDCPCDNEMVAGEGGIGGEAQVALAYGGNGGDAYYPPGTGGPGGLASAICGNGGDGGKGGSCIPDILVLPPVCKVGQGGEEGGKGGLTDRGGHRGEGNEGAADGINGTSSTQDCKDGGPGPDGDWKCLLD